MAFARNSVCFCPLSLHPAQTPESSIPLLSLPPPLTRPSEDMVHVHYWPQLIAHSCRSEKGSLSHPLTSTTNNSIWQRERGEREREEAPGHRVLSVALLKFTLELHDPK